jgi:glycosyltransferase involved in cell wall biosynthesis
MIISVIIPCFEEINTIPKVLQQMCEQKCIGFQLEILVIDGGSTDGTFAIAKEWEIKDPRIKVFQNLQKTTNHAFNIGILNAKGSHFALINAHTYYPNDYLQILWETMQRTGAIGVSGRVVPILRANDFQSQLVFGISTSPFGVSSESYRMGRSGYSDSVSLPLFEKKAVETVGLYHPKLARNQDNEMNFKLIKAGYSLYVTQDTTASYHPPASFKKLLKYAFKSGTWNTKTWLMGIPCMKWHHFIPGAFVLGQFGGIVIFLLSHFWDQLFWGVFIWLFTNLIYFLLSIWFALKHPNASNRIKFALPLGFLFFHLFYGLGNVYGLAFKSKNPKF